MSKFFIERPIFAIVMAIVISIAGVLCMFTLPVDRYPHITPPQVSVHATYYGADSQVVNDTVAEVIEKQVVSVEGFDNMSSTSNSNGSYSLNVQFKSGVDDDMATVRVQNAVSQATAGLPDSVKTLGVTTQKSSGDMALVISLQSPNNTYDAAFLKNYFSINYLDELKTIPGVGNITEWGSDYAMRVWLDPMKMTKNNITTSEIVNAIATQNQQIAGGIIGTAPVAQGTALQYIVNAEGRLKTPEQFGEIVLRTNADGSLLKLKDVSRIVLDQRSYDFIARSGNHASSALGISLTSDANAVQTLTQIKEKLAQDAKSFPEDMTYAINMDNTDFINASINEVMHTFFEALVLVAIIVYIFLQNWRSTLIPMIAVPVSLLGTIASFEVLGFTINTLTLFAMVLAIGLVVDDAIVVIEAVEYEMRYNNKSPKEATYIAMQKVQSPVIGVACVLAAVFVPVSFLGGIMGILYKQFALTIAISVILSAFVALSLTPTLCASILKEESKVIERGRLQKFWDKFNDGFDRMVKIYGNFLRRLAKRLVVPMGVLVALTVISGVLFVKLPTAFLPSEDNGYFFASFTLPEGSVNVRTNQEVEKFLRFIAKQPGVQEEMGITGFDILSGGQKSNAATSFVKLKPWDERKTPDTSVDAMVGKAFAFGAMNPGANIIAMNPPPIPGLGTSSGFTLYILDKSGGSMEELNNVTNQFLAAANQRPEINGAYTTFRMDTPAYHYDVDRLKAERNGVNIGDIFSTLATFYGGNTVNDFTLFGRNYKVVVEGDTPFRMNLADNKYVTVRDASGNMVPIGNFITPTQTSTAAVITRFNNFPAVKIGGNNAAGYSSGQALTALQEVADQVLPSGYSYAFADTSEQELEAGNKTVYALSLGILFVFLSLAALYESWKIPFSILFGLPTGFFGAVVAAFAFNVYNDIYFQIGLLTIIGLAAKNAILIVEYAKVRVDNGMDVVQSAIEAAEIRLRPILMTSLAFILGNIPLALSTGAGSVSRSEMGIAVVFGVTSATIFQIFIIPMLFIVLERINFSGLRKKILKR
ncbi:MAG: hydrophobe/amphiphile efflux-1 family RND transporter [Veillonellaceae bacterium]|uniref:efflux RND transporter permease subunit n=1 Tax=uncultured Allisonella sp. TaxID=339338 RepID=UPI000D7B3C6D|nr:multidrug efflux RND transporter permease subunit [uncultured Allisonella sp.]PWL46774.1 MAG: hydrophobe/amphiphile efflux-1 family RND transporter [Veillonellaceae bacterium]